MNGTDLLAEFRATRAEGAFSELVRRYGNLVYSVAKRRVADVTLAQEVTQIVFIRLAKAPPRLVSDWQLLAWLHRTTVHVSIDLWRSETRRRAREQHAMAMQNNPTEEAAWNEMTPVLDEALDGLDEADRQVILLRFFEQKTMADLARSCGISEDAAKMRVSRALERLRKQLGGLGATCGAALLGTLLSERAVQAAPNGLAPLLAGIRMAAPAGLVGGLVSLLSGAPGAKLLPALAVAILIFGAALLWMQAARRSTSPGGTPGATSSQAQGSGLGEGALAGANLETNGIPDPDPVKLLEGVVRARKRIASGIVEFDVVRFGKDYAPRDATNETHLKIQFEEGRIWSETLGQRFAFVSPGGPEEEAIRARADQMPLAQAVREGLIRPFTSHDVAFYDGQAEADYRETDDKGRATITKPGYSGIFLFDPRCIGVGGKKPFQTIETCLGYKDAKAVKLIGQEPIEGDLAWHIQVNSKYDDIRDFWIDVLHPTRVLKAKAQQNGYASLSRYSDTDLKDPLPIEIREIDSGPRGFRWDFARRRTEYNVSIAPVCWTLDGLHMKVGTEVSDDRNHPRRIGFWNGAGLSELAPKDQPQQPPNRAELLALLDNDAASLAGFGAALWVLTNSPDGADVEKAADVIIQSHAQSPEMGKLIHDLDRMRPDCSTNLLRAISDQNPDLNVRGNACMVLATLQKDAGEYGKEKAATAEAEKLYERVIAEFGQVPGERGQTLAELAQPQLSELRRLSIGKAAPEMDGQDLDGRPMKLSDYRGQVVVLLFWSASYISDYDAREFHRLVEQMNGKPFVLLGISAADDTEQAKAAAEKFLMNWRSFQDAREGPIAKTYYIGGSGWPTIYILDRKGVIRYRGVHFSSEVAAAVDKLLQD